MAEFLFVGSLALIFATLLVLFLIVVAVALYCVFEEIRTRILIAKLSRVTRDMTRVSEELQNADTIAFFARAEMYYDSV
jgi:cell division protein FtsL